MEKKHIDNLVAVTSKSLKFGGTIPVEFLSIVEVSPRPKNIFECATFLISVFI